MSNGGMMAHRLGIELGERIAAIAPVVATLFGDEPRPGQPVSALMLNGMLDESVPYRGGPTGGRFADAWDGTPTRPALAQAEFWAAANRCAADPERIERERYIFTRYDCKPGRAVEIYLVKDNGHAWPGGNKGSRRGDEPSTALSATDVIWRFFSSHPKALY
jgi:polyhydroxybutyrate depolymerase